MTILRQYDLTADADGVEPLRAALRALADRVRPLAGCEGVFLYQDMERPESFVFVERWTDRESHREAGSALGRDAFAQVSACLAEPPVGRYLAVDAAEPC